MPKVKWRQLTPKEERDKPNPIIEELTKINKELMDRIVNPPSLVRHKTFEELAAEQAKQDNELFKSVPYKNEAIKEAEALTNERGETHGDWLTQSDLAQRLKYHVRHSYNATPRVLSNFQLEALEMICVKISRICTGNPNEPDHWDDIAGYAKLGKSGHD